MIAWSYSDTKLCGLLPELAQDANKYTRGKVSLVAGCSRYPGAAALAAGDEHHIGASERLGDVVAGLIGGLTADLGVGASAQAAGQVGADVHLDIGIRDRECLSIGVDGNKLDAADALFDHSIDRVGTAAADADHLNDGKVVVDLCLVHVGPPNKGYSHSMG